jgi:hypothetical protein
VAETLYFIGFGPAGKENNVRKSNMYIKYLIKP